MKTGAVSRSQMEMKLLVAALLLAAFDLAPALESWLDGDPAPVLAALADPETTVAAARALSECPDPAGLRLLADAVAGRPELPPAARARLATFEPDTYNGRGVRPLGAERIDRLLRVAATDPDHRYRLLAARILHRADGEAERRAAVRAYALADSAWMDRSEWEHRAGKIARPADFRLPIPLAAKVSMLRGRAIWTWDRAQQDFVAADELAREIATVYRQADARLKGEVLLFVESRPYFFLWKSKTRQRAVPALLAFLEEVEAGAPGDPADLRTLDEWFVRRMRDHLAAPSDSDDFEEWAPPEILPAYAWGEIPERTRLDPARRARLAGRMETAADPRAAWAAARALAKVDPPALFRHGADLVATEWSEARPLTDALSLLRTPAEFRTALEFVAGSEGLPSARAEVFEGLTWAWGERERSPEEDADFLEMLFAWVHTVAPRLPGDLSERVLGDFANDCPDPEYDERWPEGTADRWFETLAEAVAAVEPEGPRRRLQALVDEIREWREK